MTIKLKVLEHFYADIMNVQLKCTGCVVVSNGFKTVYICTLYAYKHLPS